MASLIWSRIEYLIATDSTLMLLLHSKMREKVTLIDGFSTRFNENSEEAYFLRPLCISCILLRINSATVLMIFLSLLSFFVFLRFVHFLFQQS